RITQIHINLTRSFEHTKTPRGRVEKRDERLRENVLPGVLLHVVQSTRPVHTPVHNRTTRRRRTLDHVQHTIVTVVDALNHARSVERSGVAWLAASSRIKRS